MVFFKRDLAGGKNAEDVGSKSREAVACRDVKKEVAEAIVGGEEVLRDDVPPCPQRCVSLYTLVRVSL